MSTTDDELARLRAYLDRREARPLPEGSVNRVTRSVVSHTRAPQRPRRVLAVAMAGVTAAALAAALGTSLWATHGRSGPSGPAPQPTAPVPLPTATATATPTASPSPTAAGTATAGFPLHGVTWSSLDYGLDCGNAGYTVQQVSYPTPAPGIDLAVVLLRCNAGAGSPPAALLVYDRAASAAAAHLAQTLVSFQDNWVSNGHFTVDGSSISLAVTGYSSNSVPRSSPDVKTTLTWAWRGNEYTQTSHQPAHVRGP